MRGRSPYLSCFIALLMIVSISLGLVACAQGSNTSGAPTIDRLAATPLPTLNFKQPTTMIKTRASEAAEESTTAVSTADANLAQGEGIYIKKECGSCHGAKGEGVTDKAKVLAGITLTEEEFTDILRTGGKGTLGNGHLYGPQAISPSGIRTLYAYIKSFPVP